MSDLTDGINGGTARYSVPQAARYLGISERAVRKRITTGSLVAERDGRQWIVFLSAVPDAVPGGTSGGTGTADGAVPAEPIEAQYRVTPAEIEQAIERTGDKYVADINALAERFDQLYRHRLAEKDQIIAGKDDVIAAKDETIDALRGRVSALEAQQAETPVQAFSTSQTATDAATDVPWWAFWKRFS